MLPLNNLPIGENEYLYKGQIYEVTTKEKNILEKQKNNLK